ncbi:MAG: ABC transporter permease [Fusobacteriaceae bacterium]
MTIDIKYYNLLYLLILFVPSIYIINKVVKKDYPKKTIWATFRMIVQLLLVGIYLEYIFKWDNPWINFGYFMVMVFASSYSSVKSSVIKGKKIILITFISSFVPLVIAMLVFEGLVIGTPELFKALYLIPIAGMTMGNCLAAQIVILSNFMHDIKKSKDEYMFSLSMGATKQEALRPYISHAMEVSLRQRIGNMMVIGIVSIPGMMTGQMLGGNSPMVAIKYQILIMVGVLCVVVISSYMLLNFISHYYFDKYSMIDENLLN